MVVYNYLMPNDVLVISGSLAVLSFKRHRGDVKKIYSEKISCYKKIRLVKAVW